MLFLMSSAQTQSLNILWQGMLVLFIGMGIIYLAILLLSLVKDRKEK